MTTNPYRAFVDGFARLLADDPAPGKAGLVPPGRPAVPADAPRALVFSPHPDDEVIIGGLPLRLLRESRFDVVNVAVTLGSRSDRRAARWRELEDACAHVGFGLVTPDRNGLEGIDRDGRARRPERWAAAVEAVAGIVAGHRPDVVFLPHADDWNRTHVGTHHLVLDALGRCPDLACHVVETEFWGAMAAPNLMVESSADDVADLVAALSLHTGEVARNPYHLRLPAWMIDNVRRGAELVGGQGGTAPGFAFATLYRLRRWADGRPHEASGGGRVLAARDDPGALFTANPRRG